MFIRQTRTNNTATGEAYFTYRLVRGQRIAGKVRQVTVLNLGRHFDIAQEHWPLLCSRIEQLISQQSEFCPLQCPDAVERAAQHYAHKLIAQTPSDPPGRTSAGTDVPLSEVHAVDVNSVEYTRVRSVGVEHVALYAVNALGLLEKLQELGVNAVMRACIVANLVARMAAPASELATWQWLTEQSALGELLDVDFEQWSHMRLYRSSDLLVARREQIERHVFGMVSEIFALQQTVTLFDLTNTYLEGDGDLNEQARFGRSKEKRSDCPLLTLALVLDDSGFVQRSRTFAGNVAEATTLKDMLVQLQAGSGALVIMDAGIATQANIDWLVQNHYHYLVVRRGGVRSFDESQCVETKTQAGQTLKLQRTLSEDGKEVLLYCRSQGRQLKEEAMLQRFCEGLEKELQKLNESLGKPRGKKSVEHVQQRIGRIQQKSRGASQHYTITVSADESGKKAQAVQWSKQLVEGSAATHPGVYCLRTDLLEWDAQRLWQTYASLTDIESVFRSLKGDLGLRPVFHHKKDRADIHLFITVLAYQCVQVIRSRLKHAGIGDSWASLRKVLQVQRRITTTMRRADGHTVHVRKASKPEPTLASIYAALGIAANPGGTKKLIV